MPTDAMSAQIEHNAQHQGQGNGKVYVGIVSLQRARQLGGIRHSGTHDDIAEASGRIEICLVGGL